MEERERGEGRQEKKEASALISFLEQVRNKCYHVWGGNGLQRVGVDWTGTMKSWDKEGGACHKLRQGKTKLNGHPYRNGNPEQNIKFTVTCIWWPWGNVSKECPKRTINSRQDEVCSSKYETEWFEAKLICQIIFIVDVIKSGKM